MQQSSYEQLLDLLKKEQATLASVEQLTEQLLYAPIEDLDSLLSQRLSFIQSAAEFRRNFAQQYQAAGKMAAIDDPSLAPAADQPEQAIRQISLTIRATVERIRLYDPAVNQRLKMEQDRLLTKLQSFYSSGARAAEKYFKSVQTGLGRGRRLDSGRYV